MTPTPTWAFDESEIPDPNGRGERMVRFARILKHPKSPAPGGRLILTPWQERILRRIYGPSDEHGNRTVRLVYMLLPRGSRKTTLGAVMALGHAIGPMQIPGGQVVCAALDRTQARLAFDEAAEMIRLDPVILDAVRIRDTLSRIEHRRSRSVYSAISADGDAQLGKSPSFVLADELAAWRGFVLWNALKTGANKVDGSLVVIITTAAENPSGPGFELYRYARRVALGEVQDEAFLPILFEADPADAWDDEEVWHRVMPGLRFGFPDIRALRDDVRIARELPALRRAFETFHLNRWQDGAAAGWLEMAVWDAGAAPIDREVLAGRPCWIGVDLSRSYDLTAIVAAFRDEDDDGAYTLLCRAFLPEATLRKRAMESDTPWIRWRDEGHLTVTPGSVQDEDAIEAAILDLAEVYDVQEIACDPAFAGRMMSRLIAADLPVVEHPQKAAFMAPGVAEFERAAVARKLRHGGHPVLRWCVANVSPRVQETGLRTFSKVRSRSSIDLAQAAAMAIGRAAAAGAPVVDVWDAPDFDPSSVIMNWS